MEPSLEAPFVKGFPGGSCGIILALCSVFESLSGSHPLSSFSGNEPCLAVFQVIFFIKTPFSLLKPVKKGSSGISVLLAKEWT
jgi:hypothetical protein